jgi:hypothetical protein
MRELITKADELDRHARQRPAGGIPTQVRHS